MLDYASQIDALCTQLLDDVDPKSCTRQEFLGRQFDLGLAWVSAPFGAGGLALPPKAQRQVVERLRAAGAPQSYPKNPIGYGMAAPTILEHGTPAQINRHLRPLFTGEEIWCQLFSEPDAGSDLASVATRAHRDGDDWVVSGQKVWTTLAHVARWGLLLARTDPDSPKHRGLTYYVLDMNTAGIEVRPLFQMTGEAEFNEVYLSDVRVPDSARLGAVGDGWRVAMSTLMSERVAIGGQPPARGGGIIGQCVDLWKSLPVGHSHFGHRDCLTRLWVRAEVGRLTNLRAAAQRLAGSPGPEGSIGKIASASLLQDATSFALEVLGPSGTLMPSGYPMQRANHAMAWTNPQQAFLRARANSIEGGTTEIAKTVLAERVLGLPKEPGLDRDIPRSQSARSTVTT